MKVGSKNTFVVSFGPKGSDHDPIFMLFRDDISRINGPDSWFYCKKLNTMIQCHVDIVEFLADSPEFHDMKHLSRGNSQYTSMRGCLMDTSFLWNKIVACDDCFKSLTSHPTNFLNRVCLKCVCWDPFKDDYNLLQFESPRNFPEKFNSWFNGGFLKRKLVSNKHLKESLDIAHDNYVMGNWTYENADTYMKVSGIKGSTRNKILEHADNEKTLHDINLFEMEGPDVEHIHENFNKFPHLYKKYPYPPTWDDLFDVTLQVVAPMHTLCLNVIKNTHEMGLAFAASRRKKGPFIDYTYSLLMQLVDMKLEWLKVLPTFSGMVSENWLAFGFLLRWIYSSLPDISPDVVFVKPTKPIHLWLLKECNDHFQYYGLSKEGNVNEKRERILELESNPSSVLLDPEERIGSVLIIEQLMSSLSIALSYAMSNEVDESIIVSTDRHLHIFFSHCGEVSEKLYPDKSKSKLESSYSYLAVLQIVSIMKTYRCVRNLWEGSFQGEGILSEIKPLISDLRCNWHLNAGQKHHIGKSLKLIMEKYVQDSSESYIPLNHCCYLKTEDVKNMFHEGTALSVVHHIHDDFFIVLKNNQRIIVETLNFKMMYFGMAYFHWKIQEDSVPFNQEEMKVDFYADLLPLQKKHLEETTEENRSFYALITSDHKELLPDGTIGRNVMLSEDTNSYSFTQQEFI